jgi:cation:H+ antiporter
MVPLLALLAGTSNQTINEEVGLVPFCAPLMLSICLMAIAIIRRRGLFGHVQPERSGFIRDLQFFLFAFAVARHVCPSRSPICSWRLKYYTDHDVFHLHHADLASIREIS